MSEEIIMLKFQTITLTMSVLNLTYMLFGKQGANLHIKPINKPWNLPGYVSTKIISFTHSHPFGVPPVRLSWL